MNRTLAALATLMLAPLLLTACQSPAPGDGTNQSAVSGTPSTFLKSGNNGTVSCADFCVGSQWGATGRCEGMLMPSIPCDNNLGYLANGTEETCTCVDGNGAQFVKHNDNGTVSCSEYCAGSQWGEVGSCVAATVSTNINVNVNGDATAVNNDCNTTPGYLNGAQLACFCDVASCVKATCAQSQGFCGIAPDGCGGSINCSNNCKTGETCDSSICVPPCAPTQSTKSLCGNQCNISVTDSCGNSAECACKSGLSCGDSNTCCTGLQQCNPTDCGQETDDCGDTYNCEDGCPSPGNVCMSVTGQPINEYAPCSYGGLDSDGVCFDGECIVGT